MGWFPLNQRVSILWLAYSFGELLSISLLLVQITCCLWWQVYPPLKRHRCGGSCFNSGCTRRSFLVVLSAIFGAELEPTSLFLSSSAMQSFMASSSRWSSNFIIAFPRVLLLKNFLLAWEHTSSRVSILRKSLDSAGYLIASNTLKLTSSSCTLTLSFPLSTFMITLVVFINGLPKIKGTSTSSSMSLTTNKEKILSTLINKSSTIPCGCLTDLSTNYRVIHMGCSFISSIFFSMDKGIRFMLAPKSSSVFPIVKSPIATGIVKLPGSLNFWGRVLWMIALQLASNSTISCSIILLFLVNNSFMNLA